jgi:CTP synthase
MQVAAVEYARNVLKLPEANSTEFSETPDPVICLLEEQKTVTAKGASMRRGAHPCLLEDGSLAAKTYGKSKVSERHRHRYEFNPKYREQFAAAGLRLSGVSPDGQLVEILEIDGHPWFLAVQFHPEFKSKPMQPHPLFHGFIGAALARRNSRIPGSAQASPTSAPLPK